MARMPASTPTENIRADEWLPGEYIEVVTYCGAAMRESISDALTDVRTDPISGKVDAIAYTSGHAATVRRRLAIKGWKLFSEVESGVAGPEIPFNQAAIDDLDPAYAAYVDEQLLERWSRWRVVAGKGTSTAEDPKMREQEDAAAAKTFQDTTPAPARRPDGPKDTGAVPA